MARPQLFLHLFLLTKPVEVKLIISIDAFLRSFTLDLRVFVANQRKKTKNKQTCGQDGAHIKALF